MFKLKISLSRFPPLQALESTGLRRSDPRLKEMVSNLEKIQETREDDLQKLVIGRKEFKE